MVALPILNMLEVQGANNLEDLVSVNRIGIPASVQERWIDRTCSIIYTPVENVPMGLAWSKHNETDKLLDIIKIALVMYSHKYTTQ